MKDDLIPLVNSLPTENRNLLKHIALFLKIITDHEEVNKMSAKNLSTVFGPNLLRFPDNNDIQMIIRDAPRLAAVTSTLIENAPEIFCDRVSLFLLFCPFY